MVFTTVMVVVGLLDAASVYVLLPFIQFALDPAGSCSELGTTVSFALGISEQSPD